MCLGGLRVSGGPPINTVSGPPLFSLPSIPTDVLSTWIQPVAALGFLGLLLAAFHGMQTEFKEEIRASEASQAKLTDGHI